MSINFKRVLHFAFTYFYRNKGMSLAAVFVLTVTILLITGLFFVHGISNFLIDAINNKIDVTAYFKADTPEQDILNIKDQILKNSPNIKNIQYVSKEDALNNFLEKHKGSDVFSKALTEVGDNPFLPSLSIITNGSPSQYQQIANVLQSPQFSNVIDKVDFSEKKATIEKVFSITSNVNKIGFVIGLILVLIVMSVVFSTIKLIIENSKEEIATMKIVGASNWFIKAPFIIEGAMFGVISFVICLFITILSVYSLSYVLSVAVPDFTLSSYFISNFWIIILIQLCSGVSLGVLSSLIVVNKYLKV